MRRGWRRGGVKERLVAVSMLGVAVALAVGILVFANLLNRSLVAHLGTSTDAAAEVAADALGEGGLASVQAEDFSELMRVQVVTASGQVVFSSFSATSAMSALRPVAGGAVQAGAQYWWVPFGDQIPWLVSARGVRYGGQDYVVLVSSPQGPTHEAVSTTALIMLALSPLIVALVGGITWWLVGRALRPVEAIRDQVARLTGTQFDHPVPVPNTHDEVAALAVTMNQMLARLSAARKVQLRFIADASHELRSPLTGLSGLLEVARADDSLQTWRELEPVLSTEADQMSAVVQNLLLLSRVDGGRVATVRQDVDLDDLAWEEVGRLRTSTALTVITAIQAARVTGDRMALTQVLRNLCDNAARHARTTVRITARPAGASARWVVEDDGSGVAEADRDRVFDRFVRLDESRSRDTGGSGLGLAIVRDVVVAHGGSVALDASADLGGARLVVELPSAHPGVELSTIR
jgi:signal transduction histidine kinase